MKQRLSLVLAAALVALAGCNSSSNAPRAVEAPPATNDDGTLVTGTITAQFDPSNAVVPFPINLFFSGTTDLTLNIPVADPTDFSDPLVGLNALDGFSTLEPWVFNFDVEFDASTLISGDTVRVFEVTLTGPGGGVTSIVGELIPGTDYVAVQSSVDPTGVAIVPLRPLKELTTYMAVVTNGIKDLQGNNSTSSQTYFIGKRTDPLVDGTGSSTLPLLDDATAQALEPLRQLINSQEFAAASVGIDRDSIVLSWTLTTQSITPTLTALRAFTAPSRSVLVPTGLSTAAAGAPGLADIYIGTLDIPYFLGAPSAANPIAPLNTRWEAPPGNYFPPCDQFGLDPTSTNITACNPVPALRSVSTVPVALFVPNAGTGMSMPPDGWPIAIFQHGITRNRADALAIADTLALAGHAVIAIDHPLHGLTDPNDPLLGSFYAGNTPFPDDQERTFDVDFIDNGTGGPGMDGAIDPSGAHYFNLTNLLVTRDNGRQSIHDLGVLAATIPTMDINGDGMPDFDGNRIVFVGQSLGSIGGLTFLAVGDTSMRNDVNIGFLSVPGGGIARFLEASPAFGQRIRDGLAAAGIFPGTSEYQLFFTAFQTIIDNADPANWVGIAAAGGNPMLLHQVNGDLVIPNAVPGAPNSGTEPLIRNGGFTVIDQTFANPAGIQAAVRFSMGGHGSLLSPADGLATTVEMQGQLATFIGSAGTTVVVTDNSVIQPAN